MKAILAHVIVYKGREYPMHIAGVDCKGNISLKPFDGETPQTVFIPGRVEVDTDAAGNLIYKTLP